MLEAVLGTFWMVGGTAALYALIRGPGLARIAAIVFFALLEAATIFLSQ
ncbi:hypothetical protein OIE66_22060 [Nonomuraea sp. NBC_01738]|nr:hypothetical protein OIE66_22060 [Nonomuraea sp. NBC_01738]